jgi:hypothetical protein
VTDRLVAGRGKGANKGHKASWASWPAKNNPRLTRAGAKDGFDQVKAKSGTYESHYLKKRLKTQAGGGAFNNFYFVQ